MAVPQLRSFTAVMLLCLSGNVAVAIGPVEVAPPSAGGDAIVLQRLQAATQAYEARLAEFAAGRSPANVVIQSNLRLLQTSLAAASATGERSAAVAYERRAADIESLAEKNLELKTGSLQELAQAKASRLDVIVRDHLNH